MRALWRERATGAVMLALAAGGYQLGRARADGIPTAPSMYFGATIDEGGVPVVGSRDVTVRLYDAETAGTLLCQTIAPSTTVTAGRLRVALDAACTTAVQQSPNVWSELVIGVTTLGRRSKLGAVPYAVEAQRADALTDRARARVNDPDCPGGYTRDATATDIVLCRKALVGGAFDEVVKVGTGPAAFWVDRYEASVWQSADGSGSQYGAASDDYPASFLDNGQARRSGFAYAISRRDVLPSRYLTWFQMQVACRAGGKRLPTNEEWQAAAAGTEDPGVSAGGGGACVTMATGPRETGRGTACVSIAGAQDMVGNLSELTSEWVMSPRLESMGPSADDYRWSSGYGADSSYWVASAAYDPATMLARVPGTVSRGGWWPNGTAAGVFALALDAAPSRGAPSNGFRCLIPRP